MAKKGIENVRGGSFCNIGLSTNDLATIQKMITSASDKCFTCGEKGHFAKECPHDTNKETYIIVSNDNLRCNRCYRFGYQR